MPWLLLLAGAAAQAQTQQQVGGAIGAGYNPSQMPMSPTAQRLGSDPTGDNKLKACVAMAQAAASAQNTPDLTSITSTNALSTATSDLGGMLGGAIGSAATGGSIGAGALNGAMGNFCAGQFAMPNINMSLKCDVQNGVFNPATFDAQIALANQNAQTAGCKAAQETAAGKIVGCFEDVFQGIKNDMQQVSNDFTANITTMNAYITQTNALVQTQDTVLAMVGGGPSGGGGAIAKFDSTITEVQQALSQIEGSASGGSGGTSGSSISGLQIQINQQNDMVTKFQHDQVTAHANDLQGCISGAGASTSAIHTCPSSTADLLTPEQCVLSVYRDSIATGLSNSKTYASAADQRKANDAKKILSERLDQMLSDLGGDNPLVQNSQQFQAKYGAELSKYGAAGQQLLVELQNCDSQVTQQINQQLANPADQQLGSQASALRNTAQTLSSQMSGMINQLDTVTRDAGNAFFGSELNGAFNPHSCQTTNIQNNQGNFVAQQTALQGQLSCVQKMDATLYTMLNGTPAPGAAAPTSQPLSIPGLPNLPADLCAQIQPGNCRCAGLRDCDDQAKKLFQLSAAKRTALLGSGTYTDASCPNPNGCPGLAKFGKDATSSIQNQLNAAAAAFSLRVNNAKGEFSELKYMLNGLNINLPVGSASGATGSAALMCPPPADNPPSKLCDMPPNFGDMLAGLGGVPSIDPSQVSQAEQQASQQATTYQGNKQTLQGDVQQLLAQEAACKKDAQGQATQAKVQAIGLKLNTVLSQCSATGGTTSSPGDTSTQLADISSQISDLSSALMSACQNADPSSGGQQCQSLGSQMQSSRQTCANMINANQPKQMSQSDWMNCARTQIGPSGGPVDPNNSAVIQGCGPNPAARAAQ